MRKTLYLILFLFLSFNLFSQDWTKEGSFFIKKDGNIIYGVDSIINFNARNNVVTKTKEYIEKDLQLLQESDFSESMAIILFHDRGEMHRFSGKRTSGFSIIKNSINQFNQITVVYDSEYCPLNKELIKVIVSSKWGNQKNNRLIWLIEGLATYATPEADGCDGFCLEKKYAYLLQNNKLVDLTEEITTDNKAARIQSAFLVKNLIDKYGIKKLKLLWQKEMTDFEEIYGTSINIIVANINKGLKEKYRKPIRMDWDRFIKDCIDPQPDDWLPAYNPPSLSRPEIDEMVTKDVDNIRFTLNSAISIEERNNIIVKTKEYIAQNLALINESEFDDYFELMLVRNRAEMAKYFGGSIGGQAVAKSEDNENLIYCIYGDKYSPLKHELMHIVTMCKWGYNAGVQPEWLVEGMAVFANPEVYSCDGHTLEERYIYFLQTGKLLSSEALIKFPEWKEVYENKLSYNQSAYIVSVLFKKYGVEKIKELWQNGMKDFERIYGMTFDKMIENINSELNKKYPNPIEFNWKVFKDSCIG